MKSRFLDLADSNAGLWILTAAPVLWAAHFLASYIVAAIWCGRVGGGSIAPVRTAIAAFTIAALAGIAGVAWIALLWRRGASGPPSHDADTAEDRRAFMGMATLLLSGLSGVGVVYSALAGVLSATCD